MAQQGLADRLTKAMGGEVKDLAGHLNEMQIAARQCQALFNVIDELIDIGSEQALEVAVRVAEVGRDVAHKANVGLDATTLAELGVGA